MKVKTAKSLLNPKTTLHKILLSEHAQTLEADILHLQEKATKHLTDMYKWCFGLEQLIKARQ